MFIDEVDILVRAGKGGDGCLAFLREKYRPQGGPAGGDGGHGGSVVFQALPGLRTLADFRGRRILTAKNGMPGEGRNKSGKSAKNLLVKVPVGTVIRDLESGEFVGDLTKPGQKLVVAKGGKGGMGNARFATPTHRAPRKFEVGDPGEERNLRLELKLLADVGLVGLPNVGKSTLVGAVSTVRPKIADYPFTTLLPSVGVVKVGEYASFTMADIPGLIALASEGKGLGHRFLKHIQRTSVICHLVEIPFYADSFEERFRLMAEAYVTIRKELEAYDIGLTEKKEVVCWTKIDIFPKDEIEEFKQNFMDEFVKSTGCPTPVMLISAVSGDGIMPLIGNLVKMLELDPTGIESEREVPEYMDGEAPEGVSAKELSMENLEEEDEKD
jgi:GTPase